VAAARRPVGRAASRCLTTRTASSTSSVSVSSRGSAGRDEAGPRSVPRIQSTQRRPELGAHEHDRELVDLARSAPASAASNSSSIGAEAAGQQTKPCEYFTNIVLRAKK
jgi:hypothetical protein